MRLTKPSDLIGRTIVTCETVRSEYGRTWDYYLLFTFSDGTKAMTGGIGTVFDPASPRPTAECMAAAPGYFSPDDIADCVRHEEVQRRQKIKEQREMDERQLKELQRRLGVGGVQ